MVSFLCLRRGGKGLCEIWFLYAVIWYTKFIGMGRNISFGVGNIWIDILC